MGTRLCSGMNICNANYSINFHKYHLKVYKLTKFAFLCKILIYSIRERWSKKFPVLMLKFQKVFCLGQCSWSVRSCDQSAGLDQGQDDLCYLPLCIDQWHHWTIDNMAWQIRFVLPSWMIIFMLFCLYYIILRCFISFKPQINHPY